jgi:hypothetical protein
MPGTRKPIKPSVKEGKEERFQSASTRSAKNAVKKASPKKNVAGRIGIVKKNIKSKKLMAEARLAAQRKIAAKKKREEQERKRKKLIEAAKKKGIKLRTDYTALYRNKKK